jgi:hypothetical protein
MLVSIRGFRGHSRRGSQTPTQAACRIASKNRDVQKSRAKPRSIFQNKVRQENRRQLSAKSGAVLP